MSLRVTGLMDRTASPARPSPVASAGPMWPARGRFTRWTLIAMIAVSAILPIGTAAAFLVMYLRTGKIDFPYPDFFAFWSYGRFALTHPPAELFDDPAVIAFQHAAGLEPAGRYPFLYPPIILLALKPLAALPYEAARIAWTALGLAAYLAALAPWRWRAGLPMALLVAPATFGCALIGQNGFWSGALMLGGLRILERREWVAGVLFGLLAYKPQLAILVPVALLAGGYWRSILAATCTVAALLAASLLVTGPDVWAAWLDSMADHAHALASGRDSLATKMPTVTAAVRLMGGGMTLANVVQAAATPLAALAVWRVGRAHDAGARALLPVATFFATPHAFYYDLTLVTGAVLAVIAERLECDASFERSELLLLAAAVLAPIVVVHTGAGAPLVLIPLAGLMLLEFRPWRRSRTPAPALSANRLDWCARRHSAGSCRAG